MEQQRKDQARAMSGASSDERHRRAETLLNARKTLELAEKLKLVSLNVAIESAKTRGGAFEIQRIKRELSDLTNQAVKASKEISELIATISDNPDDKADNSSPSAKAGARGEGEAMEFRKAIRLRKNLDELLANCRDALERLERLSPQAYNTGNNPSAR